MINYDVDRGINVSTEAGKICQFQFHNVDLSDFRFFFCLIFFENEKNQHKIH